jgi:HEAT repeat protein
MKKWKYLFPNLKFPFLFCLLFLPFLLVTLPGCVSMKDVMSESQILKAGSSSEKAMAAKKLVQYGSVSVLELIDLVKYDNPETRQLAVNALGEIGSPNCLPSLLGALGDENEFVCNEAMSAFRKFGSKGFPSLRNGIGTIWDAKVRINSLKLLGEQKDVMAIPEIIPLLGDLDKRLQSGAVETLVQLSPESIQPLIKCFSGNNASVIANASLALEKIGEPAVSPLIKEMQSKSRQVQERCIRVLGKLRSEQALEPLLDIFSHEDIIIRETAAEAVGNYRDRSLPQLRKMLETYGQNEFIERETLTLALGYAQTPSALELLKNLSEDKEVIVRIVAARSLTLNRTDASKELLKKLLSDRDWQVRRRAAAGLKAMDWKPELRQEALEYMLAEQDWLGLLKVGKDAFGVLQMAMNDESGWVRVSAANTMSQIKDINAEQLQKMADGGEAMRNSLLLLLREKATSGEIPLLHNLIADKDWRNRREAAAALGRIRSEEAAELLLKNLVSETEPMVKKSIIESLGEQNNPKVVTVLYSSAGDENWMIRKAAAAAIAKTDFCKDVEMIHKMLYDNNQMVRSTVAAALRKKGWQPDTPLKIAELGVAEGDWKIVIQQKDAALPVLGHMIKADSDSEIRFNCINCIGKIGMPESMQLLNELLKNDKDPMVKRAAAENLRDYGPASVKILIEILHNGDMFARKMAAEQLGAIEY